MKPVLNDSNLDSNSDSENSDSSNDSLFMRSRPKIREVDPNGKKRCEIYENEVKYFIIYHTNCIFLL